MDHFEYKNGVLHAEDVAIPDIAAEVGTPFYCYSTATLENTYKVFCEAFAGNQASVFYAIKANSNQAVIKTFADLGAGADIVSEGEMRRAMAAGIPADRIIFSGVGKARSELKFALEHDIFQINVESDNELEALSEIATSLGKDVSIAIRVNPDVDAETHEKISTGKAENKFGIDIDRAPDVYARAKALPGINPVAIAVHIGSQITGLHPLRAAYERVAGLFEKLRAEGQNIQRLDLGGGLGIRYEAETPPHPNEYATMVNETVGNLGCHLAFEPGRMMVGNAGILVTTVLFDKKENSRRFIIIDAAMNDLIRPSMYEAYHNIQPVVQTKGPLSEAVIGGPVCETGDTFARGRMLPPVQDNDLMAIFSAGAYGAVMSSTYNSRLLIPEVLVRGDKFSVVRARQTYDELLKMDQFADWQKMGQNSS